MADKGGGGAYLGLLHTTSLTCLPYALMAAIHAIAIGKVFMVMGGGGVGGSLRGALAGLDRLGFLHLVLLRRRRRQTM